MKTKKMLIAGALVATMAVAPLASFAETRVEGSATSSEEVRQGGGLPNPIMKSPIYYLGGKDGEKKIEGSANLEVRAGMMAEPSSRGKGGDVEMAVKVRSDAGIDKRLASLDLLAKRISEMKNLTADQKAEILATITAQKNELTALKVKIASDTSTTTLKADLESVSKAHRTYRLVIPSTAITAAAGRVTTIVSQMQVFGAKIEARITAIKADGKDATAAEAAYADFKAKIADAKVQADAAAALVANLQADNGVDATAEANNAALKSAKAKIELANKDLKDARKDIGVILKGVKGLGIRAEGEASTTTTVQ